MFIKNLKDLSWNIDYDGISWLINESKLSFEENKANYTENLGLTEDMLQISYIKNNNDMYLIDVGWYPDCDINGYFRIVLIKNLDWFNPLAEHIVYYPNDIFNKINKLIIEFNLFTKQA